MAPTTPANAARPYRSTLPGGDGFGRLLRAEWIKLRSVPRWRLALLAAVFLTVAAALLTAGGTSSEQAGGSGGSQGGGSGGGSGAAVQPDDRKRDPLSQVRDGGVFVHRPLAGDGSVIARVTGQAGGQRWAKAGLMIRKSTRTGAPYAAVVVTPGHGVRLHANYTTDIAGGAAAAPRWLKLTRTGTSVEGFESADGATWTRVGGVKLGGLPATVSVGMYVGSPPDLKIERQFGGESINESPTDSRATFDNVRVAPAGPQPAAPWRVRDRSGELTRSGGTYALTGSGDVGVDEAAEDSTRTMLTGVLLGLLAVVAVAVLFITAEFGRGTIRTTFAATPRRGRVLAAKAIVVGAAAFVTGLAGAFGAFLLAGPIMRSNGLAPADLTAGPVLRALIGTGAILAAVAVFSLGVAAVVRRSAAAISLVLLLVLLPQIIATGLPLSAAKWLERLTPAAGFAMQQTVHRYDTAIGPWAGLGVLCCYAAAALAAAHWRLRRRDA